MTAPTSSCHTSGESIGGQDLQFSHHENEIAQSEGAQDKSVFAQKPLV
jgi:cysteinyl-tRNA synthetase